MRLLLFVFCCLIGFLAFGRTKRVDTLVVGYANSAPFIYEDKGQTQGALHWLWEQILEKNDFVVHKQKIAAENVLDSLSQGEMDLCLYPLSITSERAEFLNFSTPFYLAHSGIMTDELTSWDKAVIFMNSFFSLNFFRVLGTLALVILIFGFLTWVFERKRNQEEFGGGIKGLWSGFWWSAVTMTTVGYGDKSPKTTGGRAVALVWMFTAVVIISSFTASIASSLTVTELGTERDSIEYYKEKKIGTVENSATAKWLKDNFYKNKVLYPSKEELIEGLKNKEIEAAAYDLPMLKEMLKKNELNKFEILDIKYNPQYYAIGMNRRVSDTLRKKINTALLKSTESYEWKVILSEYGLEIK
ncbi:MAG: transporter substrate-binding domain-containing protein [Brumimicrobium sp.]|nr:transporter substrate-binding domain-containing protein [Brumimicrobium sp.]